MASEIRVAIVDDHPLFRQGVAHILGTEPDLELIGEGGTAGDALRLARERRPDILLLDISLPGGGLNATREVSAACPATKIVILTVSETEEDLLEALRAGARAYVLKGVPVRELAEILRAVHRGGAYVTPTLAGSLLSGIAAPPTPAKGTGSPVDGLTARERDILDLVATGSSNKEIARALCLSEKTVKHHVTHLLQKLGVRNRVEAAMMARDKGRM
jgi:DNA-binding NarL/FixJ family response regulator